MRLPILTAFQSTAVFSAVTVAAAEDDEEGCQLLTKQLAACICNQVASGLLCPLRVSLPSASSGHGGWYFLLGKKQDKSCSVSDCVIGGRKMFLKIAMIMITIRRIGRDKRPSVWTPTSWRNGWCCRKKVNMSCHISASGKVSSLSPATNPSRKPQGFASSSCVVTAEIKQSSRC